MMDSIFYPFNSPRVLLPLMKIILQGWELTQEEGGQKICWISLVPSPIPRGFRRFTLPPDMPLVILRTPQIIMSCILLARLFSAFGVATPILSQSTPTPYSPITPHSELRDSDKVSPYSTHESNCESDWD